MIFGRDGVEIYCVHSQGDNDGLRISRVDNKTWKQTHTLSLPRGEGVANLTTDTEQRKPSDRFKVSRSISIVLSGDGKWIYVSHGRSVFRIEAATLTLRDTYKVVCRAACFTLAGASRHQSRIHAMAHRVPAHCCTHSAQPMSGMASI